MAREQCIEVAGMEKHIGSTLQTLFPSGSISWLAVLVSMSALFLVCILLASYSVREMQPQTSPSTWMLPLRMRSQQTSKSGIGLGGAINSFQCANVYIGFKLK
jgi:hypothetical protein